MSLQTYGDFLELFVKQLVDYLFVHPYYYVFYAALGITCPCLVTYTNNTSRMFPPFFSIINYVKKNIPNTVKFNFPGSDIVWCKKPSVNVVK